MLLLQIVGGKTDFLLLSFFLNFSLLTVPVKTSLVQFLIFDGSNKGYIIEDDCMEILYARYGGYVYYLLLYWLYLLI